MGCCGKTKMITKGFTRLVLGRTYIFTEPRIRRCKECIYNYLIHKTLWCSICHCYIPAAARVKEKHCPKGFWERKRLPEWARRPKGEL